MNAPRPAPQPDGRVVVGYDGSHFADKALQWAVDEATRRGAGLELLCASPWATATAGPTGPTIDAGQPTREQIIAMLDGAAEKVREAAPELTVVTNLVADQPPQALIDAGERAGLIVVGSRGLGGFAGLLLGSVSLRVAAHTSVPLMVVPEAAKSPEPRPAAIVAGVQSEDDRPALAFAFEEARRRDADLKVLHAWTYEASIGGLPTVDAARSHELLQQQRKLAESLPRYAIAPLRDAYPAVRVSTDHELGSAARMLVAAGEDADLLVIAAHRNPHRLGTHLGPVTHALLHHTRCPLVLVPVPR